MKQFSKILITGTAGFIGFHTANKFLSEGHEVIGIDSINDYYNPQLKLDRLTEAGISTTFSEWRTMISSTKFPRYRFIRAKLEDKKEVQELFAKEQFDQVIHLAAQPGVRYSLKNPDAYIESNIVAFMNILEACRYNGVKHLVFASSSSVYGLNQKMPLATQQNVDHPVSLYAATKKSNELMAHTYSHLFGLPTTGLRFFTVYGPWGRPDMATQLFANAIEKNKPIKIFNQGKLSRDFTYVDDIVEGVFLVSAHPPVSTSHWDADDPDPASSPAPYKIYNIGNSAPVQLMDFINAMEEAMGKEAEKQYLPMQPGDVVDTYADVSALQKDFGYQPNTGIREGLKKFVAWHKNYHRSDRTF
ncbi:MAG: NAD-dependent epimerase [Saprospiraceae bacterium]|nr:NAD-dependent epimerase [Saprospiraceae bacterium]